MTNQAQPKADELARLVGNIAQKDGDYSTAIPALTLYRRSFATDPMPCIYGLGLGLTVQGSKRVTLGDEVFEYGPSQSLITTVTLPVVSYVIRASSTEPYLGVRLELDARLIAQVASEMIFKTPLQVSTTRALSVVSLDDGLQDALIRLLQILAEPQLVSLLAPLIEREIVVRLLTGEHEPNLRRLVAVGSPGLHIAKVISWLKLHYTENVSMDDLAKRSHMSASSFRQHFRDVVGMSPLQYTKNLRLQDARQLMFNEGLDASSAAIRVGYESPSQFSREYVRLFGEPPHRDISRLRATSLSSR